MRDSQQDEILNALKAEKEINDKLAKGFKAANQMNHTLYSALVSARYAMKVTQDWGGFADDRQIILAPKSAIEKDPVVMVWGELLENISGLLDEVASIIGGNTFESIKELDKSFDLEFEMP